MVTANPAALAAAAVTESHPAVGITIGMILTAGVAIDLVTWEAEEA